MALEASLSRPIRTRESGQRQGVLILMNDMDRKVFLLWGKIPIPKPECSPREANFYAGARPAKDGASNPDASTGTQARRHQTVASAAHEADVQPTFRSVNYEIESRRCVLDRLPQLG